MNDRGFNLNKQFRFVNRQFVNCRLTIYIFAPFFVECTHVLKARFSKTGKTGHLFL